LFEIQDTGDVWIKAYYFERDATQIEVGQDAVLTFPANPSLRLQGKVKRIAPQLASKDRVLPVWIEVTNPGGFLKEGMLAEVDIKVSTIPSTLAARKTRK
jgi:multidrug efflux pump subunit AcrA (membrane-fusion protein)